MNSDARHLDGLVQAWAIANKRDDSLFEQIMEAAIKPHPATVIPFARALQLIQARAHSPAMERRVTTLQNSLDALRFRLHQVDDLGDLNNEPQTLFDILGDDAVGLKKFDPVRLRQARLAHSDSRALAANALLESLGWDQLPSNAAIGIRTAVEDLQDREQFQAWGLFVDSSAGQGVALGVSLVIREKGQEKLWSEAAPDMIQQAGIALQQALPDAGWEANIEWPASFVGESVGLPLYVAGLVATGRLPNLPLTASTGRLDIGGHVTAVSGIRQKVDAARRIGIRRLLVPRENLSDAKSAAESDVLIIPVAHIHDVANAFRQSISARELGYAALIRLVRASVSEYGLLVQDEIENANGFRFVVANAQAKVNIWIYRNGRVRPDGQVGSAMDAASRLIAEVVPGDPQPRQTLPFQLPVQMQGKFHNALQHLGAVDEAPGEHEAWRLHLSRGRSRATVILYKSGKCVLQGTAPAWDDAQSQAQQVTESLGGLRLGEASSHTPTNAINESDETEPHIGTDEAGKGDYFGPLVSAAVYVDGDIAAKLRQLGVRDSKTLSDKRVRELAKSIRELADGRFAVTPIHPRKYNDLYEQFRREGKNLNSLLAWGHGRSIENLLSTSSKRAPAKYVIVDQFADKHYIEQRTKRAGIPIHQHPKAEADIAVAAASILARDGFLQWLERMSERTQTSLPKGASPQVIEAAKQFVRRWGAKWLGEVAKLSFRTTKQVLEGENINADKRPPQWTDEPTDGTRES